MATKDSRMLKDEQNSAFPKFVMATPQLLAGLPFNGGTVEPILPINSEKVVIPPKKLESIRKSCNLSEKVVISSKKL
jgi:hypothetical protein